MSDKKIFFCARTGFDEPGAWCELWDETTVREYVGESLKQAGVASDAPITTLRVEASPTPSVPRLVVKPR